MKHITTAVIPIGGLGTRFFPLTKTLHKYLLPVYDRPILDYLLDNCIEAGLRRIVFVTTRDDKELMHYLSEDLELRRLLHVRGKEHLYAQLIAPLHGRIETVVVEQPVDSVCGTAAALLYAQPAIPEGESFVVTMGDDFLWRADHGSDLLDMIKSYQSSDAVAACMVERVGTFAALQRNAAVTLRKRGAHGLRYMQDIIEKPEQDIHPRLASIGRYIFEPMVFDVIRHQEIDPRYGELHLSGTFRLLCGQSMVLAHVMKGKQLDCGTPENWLNTNNFIARTRASVITTESQSR